LLRMLTWDPKKRITITQALGKIWSFFSQ
jgi:hypothetical protein